jgi:sigma-B regulation protein RsbU (phosphoserine phosphatase)
VKRISHDEEAVAMGRLIRNSASRMGALIDNLLDFARGRMGGGLPLNRDTKEPLEPVLREVIDELSASHPDRTVESAFALIDPIHCDRARIAQLFSNLLGNALSYGSPNQPVRVRAVCDAGHFELSVSNTGEPIPSAALERLFQPYYRNAVLQSREGLGLGLYIAHQIAIAHGGTLTATSTEEETRFTFRMSAR